MSKQYFTDEFKIEAVKQITELGYSTSEVASRLGVSAHSLYAWKKRFGKPEIQRTLEDAQEAELKRLRQELKRVTEERDILKKAAVESTGQRNTLFQYLLWGFKVKCFSRSFI